MIEPIDQVPLDSRASKPENPNRRAWRRFARNRPAVTSGWFLLAVLLTVLVWPVALKLARQLGPRANAWSDQRMPEHVSDQTFQPPSCAHWFGTDVHGRDLFSRVLYGARISLLVGAVGAGVSLLIGVLWGAVAGFVGGKIDQVMMRFVDVLYALPSIILVIVMITTLEDILRHGLAARGAEGLARSIRMPLLFVGLGAVSWLTMARIVRGQVLSLRERGFVLASRALGASPLRILLRHILPNTVGVVITYTTLTIPAVILYESFLSYLGLGIQPPMASWGSLMAEGADQLNPVRIYWWLLAFPGGLLVLTLLALNFVGDGLRDAWDLKTAEGVK